MNAIVISILTIIDVLAFVLAIIKFVEFIRSLSVSPAIDSFVFLVVSAMVCAIDTYSIINISE